MGLPDASDLLGYAAAGLVLIAFYVRSLRALRSVAIASNVMFIAYAAAAHLAPVLILHALLLPLNVWRLRQDFQDFMLSSRGIPSKLPGTASSTPRNFASSTRKPPP